MRKNSVKLSMLSSLADITKKLTDLEATFKEALDAAEVGIWEWNLETNQLYFDERMIALYEYEAGEWRMNYDCWRNRVHPDDLDGLERQIKDCIDNDIPYIYYFRIKTKNSPSGWKYIKGKGTVIRDADGYAIKMSGVNLESDCEEAHLKIWHENATNKALEKNNKLRQFRYNILICQS